MLGKSNSKALKASRGLKNAYPKKLEKLSPRSLKKLTKRLTNGFREALKCFVQIWESIFKKFEKAIPTTN